MSPISVIDTPFYQHSGFSIWILQGNWYIAVSINIETG